ncbi:MAG: fructosamine kinase family protein [Casimicrobiaceae bacterium]
MGVQAGISHWRVAGTSGAWFVKLVPAARQEVLEAEADGLRALSEPAVVGVPAVAAAGAAGGKAFLALTWLDLVEGGRDATLGRALAALHRHTGATFGWHCDNTIGASPQRNDHDADWARFFAARRIAPQLAAAARRGYPVSAVSECERLLAKIPGILAGHRPVPSLLHGDLWAGNVGRERSGRPVVFDPAVYFGDRETDLAMTELFGGFDADFGAAYREAWPLTPGYPVRRTLYNLYHVLNHFNLFGGAYGRRAVRMTQELLAEAG